MSPSDHLKAIKENHGCFSCLKRVGCDHDVSTCSSIRQCSESFNGSQCKYFHHPLLHRANATNYATALTVSSVTGSKQANSSRHSWGNSGIRKCQKARKPAPGLWCSGQLNQVVSSRRTRSYGKESNHHHSKSWRRGGRIDEETILCSHPITSELKCYPYSYSHGHPMYKQWHYRNKAQSCCWNFWPQRRGNPPKKWPDWPTRWHWSP